MTDEFDQSSGNYVLGELVEGVSFAEADIREILSFFAYEHLPEHLQKVSKPFCDLAEMVSEINVESNQTVVALQKLLESKDAAVRAAIAKEFANKLNDEGDVA